MAFEFTKLALELGKEAIWFWPCFLQEWPHVHVPRNPAESARARAAILHPLDENAHPGITAEEMAEYEEDPEGDHDAKDEA
jgi:hypothetical protein